ncbi:AraC family transcriptional regulator [Pseudomonas capeferrum]|uniref:helix-turn-helix domain-containing protein n=1 Tax=Pseudomonas capeferrum TaxID=1495066 RepID=UPI0015E2FE9A|nr:AraC family transcriptional regulator [Pseudomonas capeferrum]MBA1203322.1 AraC family transcriptional regulator [Pseudomonas capeferrum]
MVSVDASPITAQDKVFSTAEWQALHARYAAPDAVPETPFTRLSLAQWLETLTSACQQHADPLLALRVGQGMHLTAYGMVGLALLSSATLRGALEVANQFAVLMNLKHRLHLAVDGESAHILLAESFPLLGAGRHYSTLLESAKILTLLGDILGHGFNATQVNLNLAGSADDAQAISRTLGAPAYLNSSENRITFPSVFVDQPLPQSHAITHQSCKAVCLDQMNELSQRYDLCFQVQKMLLATPERIPTLTEVAARLHLSPRTLRRKLETTDSSYNQILEEVRKKLAIRYLLDTPLTTEAISEKLSYSDAANFRHAFKRWTGTAPRAFRAQYRDSDWVMPALHTLPGAADTTRFASPSQA